MIITQNVNEKLHENIILEESHNLSTLLTIIEEKIQHLKSNKPYPDVHPYSVAYDYEERQDLMFKKQCNYEHEQEILTLSKYKDNPYFARMDFRVAQLETKDEYQKIYIGKRSLNIDEKELIYDWRSPIGQRYYLKSELEFQHHNYLYTLVLRRALSIIKGRLVSFNDEYIYGDELFNNITDPFLISALKEKRYEHKLTDIIKTIQENQNNIIRFSPKNSFILQGCAGSGKTMIMLHRLSYILYNNPNLDLSKIKIITPNDNLNIHINDLYNELGLHKINKFKIDDYYIYLLSKYGASKPKNKIISDSLLDQQFISKVYSEPFYFSCLKKYHDYIKQLYDELYIDAINKICFNYDYDPYTYSSNDHDSIIKLGYHIKQILDINKGYKLELEKTINEVQKVKSKIESLENNETFRCIIRSYHSKKVDLTNKLTNLEHKIKDFRDECNQIFSIQDDPFIIDDGTDLLMIHQKLQDLIIHLIAKKNILLQILKTLYELQQELTQLSFLQFAKKQKLKNTVRDLIYKLNDNRDVYQHKGTKKVKHVDRLIIELNQSLDKIAKDLKTLNNCLHLVEQNFDLNDELSKNELDLANSMKPITELKNNLEMLEFRTLQLNKKILSEHENNLLQKKLSICQKINSSDIFYKTIGACFNELEKAFKISRTKANQYKYLLFEDLIFYSLWKGPVLNGDRFLNIDEGQDLAITEYLLLKAVNGQNTVFNIYGDINQRITSKGIDDWNKIQGVDHHFVLNENYRNTEQITQYCNQKLGFSFISIGVSGNNVVTITLEEAIIEIKQKIAGDDTKRCAIILKDYKHKTVTEWVSLGCYQGSILKGRVSLLSVEDSKGLEFEEVYVIDDNMSKNEKYISFTRALEKLVIVQWAS